MWYRLPIVFLNGWPSHFLQPCLSFTKHGESWCMPHRSLPDSNHFWWVLLSYGAWNKFIEFCPDSQAQHQRICDRISVVSNFPWVRSQPYATNHLAQVCLWCDRTGNNVPCRSLQYTRSSLLIGTLSLYTCAHFYYLDYQRLHCKKQSCAFLSWIFHLNHLLSPFSSGCYPCVISVMNKWQYLRNISREWTRKSVSETAWEIVSQTWMMQTVLCRIRPNISVSIGESTLQFRILINHLDKETSSKAVSTRSDLTHN